jgi:hypothetical protein
MCSFYDILFAGKKSLVVNTTNSQCFQQFWSCFICKMFSTCYVGTLLKALTLHQLVLVHCKYCNTDISKTVASAMYILDKFERVLFQKVSICICNCFRMCVIPYLEPVLKGTISKRSLLARFGSTTIQMDRILSIQVEVSKGTTSKRYYLTDQRTIRKIRQLFSFFDSFNRFLVGHVRREELTAPFQRCISEYVRTYPINK